jgi:hypothetical protein
VWCFHTIVLPKIPTKAIRLTKVLRMHPLCACTHTHTPHTHTHTQVCLFAPLMNVDTKEPGSIFRSLFVKEREKKWHTRMM